MEAVKAIYHPDKIDAKTFKENFTIRAKEFNAIIDNLKKQKQKPLQHFLITGKRGMGKSTLLRRIYIEAKEEPLSDKIIAVRLGSEQYKLSKLYKLWEEVIKHLSLEDVTLEHKRNQLSEERHYEEHVIQIIVDYINEQNKTLLLLIDNFDQFVDKLIPKEQHLFREILIQYPIQIIGNTVFYNEHFFKYDKPFFDFFKPVHLQKLDKGESEEFIKQLARNEGIKTFEKIFKKEKGKIETLRILSGGVPRTLVILLNILSKRNTGDAIDYLIEMLEQVTPLYQDRMKALSSQQQEIMHYLAISWDRTPAKDLAKKTRIPSKSISAQLIQLEDRGYINKITTTKRNHLYEIDERFFNIWLLMSESSAHDVKRVIWLTRWLDTFYDSSELEDYISYCNNSLKKEKPANRFLIAQALSESKKLSWQLRDQLIVDTSKDLFETVPQVNEPAVSYSKISEDKIAIINEEIGNVIQAKNDKTALERLEKFKSVDEAQAYFGMGLIYSNQLDYEKAEQCYLRAAKKGHVISMFNLGVLYQQVSHYYDKAEQYYLMAVEEGDKNSMFNLGLFYKEIRNDYDKAEEYYLMAAKKGDDNSMCNLGLLYQEVRQDDKAEQFFMMAVKKDNQVALNNLANFYFNNNNLSKKLAALQLINEIESYKNPNFLTTKIEILLWNEKIKEAYIVSEQLLETFLKEIDAAEAISDMLICLLIFKQKQFLHALFSKKYDSLNDRFKPIYFALMHEMKTEFADEYLKMTEEIKEPVDDLLTHIKKERERLDIA